MFCRPVGISGSEVMVIARVEADILGFRSQALVFHDPSGPLTTDGASYVFLDM